MRSLAILICMMSSTAFGISQEYIEDSIVKAANEVGVPFDLLRAICHAESALDPAQYVFSDGGYNNHAFGLCQVLVNTAEDHGLNDPNCRDDFRYRKEHRNYQGCKLFGPYTNAYYAAKYLKYQLNRYNNSWINAIAAYNSGSVQICKTGWVYRYYRDKDGVRHKTKLYPCEKGGLLNQRYVDRVLGAFRQKGYDHGQSNRPNKSATKEASRYYQAE